MENLNKSKYLQTILKVLLKLLKLSKDRKRILHKIKSFKSEDTLETFKSP